MEEVQNGLVLRGVRLALAVEAFYCMSDLALDLLECRVVHMLAIGLDVDDQEPSVVGCFRIDVVDRLDRATQPCDFIGWQLELARRELQRAFYFYYLTSHELIRPECFSARLQH